MWPLRDRAAAPCLRLDPPSASPRRWTYLDLNCASSDVQAVAVGAARRTDLIGHDVNAAVSRSVWEAFDRDPALRRRRRRPSWSPPGGSAARPARAGSRTARARSCPTPSTAPPVGPPAAIVIHGPIGPFEGCSSACRRASRSRGVTPAQRSWSSTTTTSGTGSWEELDDLVVRSPASGLDRAPQRRRAPPDSRSNRHRARAAAALPGRGGRPGR